MKKNFSYIIYSEKDGCYIHYPIYVPKYEIEHERLNENTDIEYKNYIILFDVNAEDRDRTILNMKEILNHKYKKALKEDKYK